MDSWCESLEITTGKMVIKMTMDELAREAFGPDFDPNEHMITPDTPEEDFLNCRNYQYDTQQYDCHCRGKTDFLILEARFDSLDYECAGIHLTARNNIRYLEYRHRTLYRKDKL